MMYALHILCVKKLNFLYLKIIEYITILGK